MTERLNLMRCSDTKEECFGLDIDLFQALDPSRGPILSINLEDILWGEADGDYSAVEAYEGMCIFNVPLRGVLEEYMKTHLDFDDGVGPENDEVVSILREYADKLEEALRLHRGNYIPSLPPIGGEPIEVSAAEPA